jgi:antitoxin YefM
MKRKKLISSAMTASDARANFYDLAKLASELSQRFIITLHGKPAVVIMSLEELEGMEETIDIMSDPELVESIRQGQKDYEEGKFFTLEEVEKELQNKMKSENANNSVAKSTKAVGQIATKRSKQGYQTPTYIEA